MRLSCIKGDSGYDDKRAIGSTVLLNGEPLDACFTADEELGVAYCYRKSPRGALLPHPYKPDELLIDERHGHVKIILGGDVGVVYPFPGP
jgi:hypothetical protein